MARAAGAVMTLDVHIQGRLGATQFDAGFVAPVGVTALFGPSGAGKTSIVNAIAGLWRPKTGRIALGDQVWCDSAKGLWTPPHKRRVGYVFQDARLFPHLSVQDNLRYGGQHDEAALVELLGLGDLLTRKPASLSGGEAQRVALARALMRRPDLVLMDEPLASLDGPRKADILPYLERLRDETQVPVIYVSHAMNEVTRLASYIVLMQAGRVVQAGPVTQVLGDPAQAHLLARGDRGALLDYTITAHDADDMVTTLTFSGGTLTLAGQIGTVGNRMRLRVPAHDIILSLRPPTGLSAQNVLPVTVTSVHSDTQGGAAIGLQAGNTALWAGITAKAARELDLQRGQHIYAIIKATAVAPA
ncbi:molybdenum ABC transporter ATP-binding protein [Yoonia sp. 208BN28-4]|uniref:molybdenum ABC transporter ATP-binding protein n=1 Tax=Yoonia sp. 208BN28-4 TaxID=3126505 RepID=UPI0030B72964